MSEWRSDAPPPSPCQECGGTGEVVSNQVLPVPCPRCAPSATPPPPSAGPGPRGLTASLRGALEALRDALAHLGSVVNAANSDLQLRDAKSWTTKVEISSFSTTPRAELDRMYEESKLDTTIIVGAEVRVLIGEIRGLRALCLQALGVLRTHDAEYRYATPMELLDKLEEVERMK